MEKCYKPVFSVEFNGQQILVDLTNKKNPFVNNEKEKNKEFYYSYSYEEDTNIPYFEIYVTDLCNMQCPYCFNNHSDNKKQDKPLYEIESLVGFIKRKTPNKELGIKFLGGEPLLNKEWIYEFVSTLEKEDLIINYNINTNLSVIDEKFMKFLKKYHFFTIVSVDGGNDPHKGGEFKGKIFQNIIKLLKEDIVVSGRMVYYPNDKKSLTDLVKQCLNTGLKVVSITIPWGEKGNDKLLKIVQQNLREFADFYVDCILNKDFRYIGISPFILYIKHLILERRCWKDNCSSGKDIYCIDIKGDIFPCHCFAGIETFNCGSIYDEISEKKLFQKYDVDQIVPCFKCDIRYMCKAKCYGDNFLTNGEILRANNFRCLCEKEIFACSVYILKEIIKNPEIFSIFKYVIEKGEKKYDNTK